MSTQTNGYYQRISQAILNVHQLDVDDERPEGDNQTGFFLLNNTQQMIVLLAQLNHYSEADTGGWDEEVYLCIKKCFVELQAIYEGDRATQSLIRGSHII